MTDTEKDLLLSLLKKWHAEEIAKPIETMNTDIIDHIVFLGLKIKGETLRTETSDNSEDNFQNFVKFAKTTFGYDVYKTTTDKGIVVGSFDAIEPDGSKLIHNPSSSCEGCMHIGLRYPYASEYPCICCARAHQKDYYNVPIDD